MAVRPPGMGAKEAQIWLEAEEQELLPAGNRTFNFRVGVGAEPPEFTPAELVPMIGALTRRRIDAVIDAIDTIWLVEVTTFAGARALGQLLTYKRLFEDQEKPEKPVKTLLLARQVHPDVRQELSERGVKIVTT